MIKKLFKLFFELNKYISSILLAIFGLYYILSSRNRLDYVFN